MLSFKAKFELADWLNRDLRPNTIAVATLLQSRRADNGSWVVGNEYHYQQTYTQFVSRLSFILFNKAWRRYKLMIPNAATLEGNGRGHKIRERKGANLSFIDAIQPDSDIKEVHWHINMMFRRPEWMPTGSFHEIVRTVWYASDWAMPDFKIEERKANFAAYALKDGPETLMVGPLSF